MTIAVFVNSESDKDLLVGWGAQFASCAESQLLILLPRRAKGETKWVTWDPATIKSQFPELDPDSVTVRELSAQNLPDAFIRELPGLDIDLLILPGYSPSKSGNQDQAWSQQIFFQAQCECLLIQGGAPPKGPSQILVATENEGDPDTIAAIERVSGLLPQESEDNTGNSRLTLLFVRPDDDLVAGHVAQRHVNRLAKIITGKSQGSVQKKIALADSLIEGIKQQDLESFDLVLVGTRHRRTMVQLFRHGNPFEPTETSVGALRKSVPVGHRLWFRFRETIRRYVPQIDREERIMVVDRLQNSSVFDFDFMALMVLSTLIATLGLARNSGSIVIGAMLVAPLMTPLVAIGFSLVQGNERLIRRAVKSVLWGFALAFGLSAAVGGLLHWTVPSLAITDEMRTRDLPNLLDFVVALASGVAGAYAMGRTHLVSAIPGVAIAAALVPPIATSGLSLAMGDTLLSGGALLLFATNIVAIVLGTSVAFWAIGITSREHPSKNGEHQRSPLVWPRIVFGGLVILSLLLAAEIGFFNPLGN